MNGPMIKVSGPSDSGKTHVVCALIRRLSRRGWDVAVIKHDPRDHWQWDHPDTDTRRHADAGASAVSIISPGRYGIYQNRTEELSPEELAKKFDPRPDLVILEGYKDRDMQGFERTREGWSDHRGSTYGPRDGEAMARAVEEWISEGGT